MAEANQDENWDLVIRPHSKWYELRLGDLVKYKDLLFLFVRRDFVSLYKQTILGPLWFFLQPIITTITFTFIFGRLAGISTDGMPQVPFYLCGIAIWNYFADTLTKTSETFTANAGIFGKVYFPRMVVPLSIVVSNLIKLGVQLILFLSVWVFYLVTTDALRPSAALFLVPFLILMMGLMGLGFGIIISSLTTKYRDLKFLVVFGVQLLMYASPVVWPLSIVDLKYRWLLLANPVTSIIETFRFAFLGAGEFSPQHLFYSAGFTIVLLGVGLIIFHRVEKNFMDTV